MGEIKIIDYDFITSDTHFNHENIIKYCNRQFSSLEEMNNSIIENWNNTVNKNSTVLILGDFSFKNKEIVKETLSKLNGKKILVKGNHDRLTDTQYLEAGFSEVYKELADEENMILYTHKPVYGTDLKHLWFNKLACKNSPSSKFPNFRKEECRSEIA